MSHSPRRVLQTACASHALIHVYELSVPALLILIQLEFGAGDFEMGRIVTVYGLLFGIGALPAGYLVDRLGSKPLLLACLWGGSLSMIGMALSPSLGLFFLCAAFMGLWLSIYHPAGTALITHSMSPTGRVFALHGMAGNMGVAAAAVLAGSLGALFGWRGAIGSLGLIGLVLGGLVLRLPTPALHDIRKREGNGRWPSFILLLVATTFMGMVYRGMTTFLPKFFATSYVQDPLGGTALAGALTTAALVIGLVGMHVSGRMIDRGVEPARVFLAGAALQVPFLVALGYVGGRLILPLTMGVAFFHFLTQPAGNRLVADFTPPRLRGLGYGIYFLMTFGAGSLGAGFGGWVSEQVGLAYMFPALAAIVTPSVIATVVLVWAAMRRKRSHSGAGP